MKKIALFFITLAILVSSCSFDEPVVPRWTTPFVLPLIKETIVFADELSKDSSFVIRGDSIFLELSGKFDGDMLSPSDLSIEGRDSSADFSLDRIELDSLNTISTGDIKITDILPSLNNAIGMTVPFPDTTIAAQTILTDSSSFISMTVTDGELIVTFHNDLPFTFTPESLSGNSIQISVYNDSTTDHITDIFFQDTIAPGETARKTAPLGPGTSLISIPLRLDYSFHILGENIFVTQDSLDAWGLKIDLTFENLEVQEITGRVTSQSITDIFNVGVDMEDQITEAVIDSGTIQIYFSNYLPLSANLRYTIPGLTSQSTGTPFSGELTVPANDSMVHNPADLNGYRIANSLHPGQPIDTLSVQTELSTDTGWVTLRANDRISVRVVTSRLVFNYIEGVLAPDTLELEPFTVSDIADYDGLTGGIQIRGAQLLLELVSQIDIQNFEIEGVVTGIKKDDAGQAVDSARVTVPAQQLNVGSNIISLSGQEVDELVNVYPTDLKAEAIIHYSGQAMVAAGDTIGGGYTFSTPFHLQISNADPITLEPDTIREVDDNFETAIEDSLIKHARLTATIVNFSPLSGNIDIFFSANPNRQDLFDTTGYAASDLEWYKSAPIPQAQVDPVSGFVTSPAEMEFIIELSMKELRIFLEPSRRAQSRYLQVGIKTKLDDTNGYVTMRGSDYVEFSGFIDTEIIFKETD